MSSDDPRIAAIPDIHGHAKGEHKPFAEERPIALTARMLFLWFYHACRRGFPRFLMVSDHMNYLTFEDPAAVNLVRRALKLAAAGDLYGAAETAGVEVAHAAAVSDGLRRGMRYSIGAEVDNDPRSRPDAQNIVDAMRPDAMIRSVHFLTIENHPQFGPNWNWPFDNEEFVGTYDVVGVEKTWELYMATLLDAIERLPGNIIGHFYVPANFGHWPERSVLEGYEDKMLEAAAARGMAIEVNTRYLYRDHPAELKEKYREAYGRLIRKAKAANVGIAVGSDAHSPRDQGGGFDEVLRMLDAADVNELVFPIGGRLARVALRATKEHLEQRAAAASIVLPGSSITGLGRAELGIDANRPAPEPKSAAASARERLAARAAKAGAAARVAPAPAPAKAATRKAGTEAAPVAAKGRPAAKSAAPAAKAATPAAKAAAPAPKTRAAAAPKAPAKAAAKAPAAAPKAKARPAARAAAVAKRRPAAAASAKGKPAAKKTPAKKAAPRKPAAPARKLAPAKPAAAKKTAKPAAKATKRPAAARPRTGTAKKAAPAKKSPPRKTPKRR